MRWRLHTSEWDQNHDILSPVRTFPHITTSDAQHPQQFFILLCARLLCCSFITYRRIYILKLKAKKNFHIHKFASYSFYIFSAQSRSLCVSVRSFFILAWHILNNIFYHPPPPTPQVVVIFINFGLFHSLPVLCHLHLHHIIIFLHLSVVHAWLCNFINIFSRVAARGRRRKSSNENRC